MSWRIAINHRSDYKYSAPVIASFNEARIMPRTSSRQTVLQSEITTNPGSSLYQYVDYWQTSVSAFEVLQPHQELTITGSSTVETSQSNRNVAHLSWDELVNPVIQDRMSEYLLTRPSTLLNDELIQTVRDLVHGISPSDSVQVIGEWVRGVMTYEPGSTHVHTSALEAWQQASGVCQDFAHLSIGLLRSLGIPARYVSGYLYPEADAPVGEVVRGASHAWIESWTGAWVGLDPTNGLSIDERHVTIARGRDYSDVTPVRGVYQGGRFQSLNVAVDLTRVA